MWCKQTKHIYSELWLGSCGLISSLKSSTHGDCAQLYSDENYLQFAPVCSSAVRNSLETKEIQFLQMVEHRAASPYRFHVLLDRWDFLKMRANLDHASKGCFSQEKSTSWLHFFKIQAVMDKCHKLAASISICCPRQCHLILHNHGWHSLLKINASVRVQIAIESSTPFVSKQHWFTDINDVIS